MNYINKFTRKKISLIQEEFIQKTKRDNTKRGIRKNQVIKSHKRILTTNDEDKKTEHEDEIEKRAKVLYKYGKFKTFKEAIAAARQEQNRKEGK